MGIPGFQEFMLPLLRYAGDGEEHSVRNAIEHLAEEFGLTEEEQKELLPSGVQSIVDNRIGWANTYLKKAGLLESPRRSVFKITDNGQQVLKENLKEINIKFLERFPQFIEFKYKRSDNGLVSVEEGDESQSQKTPEEILEDNYNKIRNSLAEDLIAKVKSCSPAFFEQLVVDLLLNMGYGGSRKDAGQALGKSGDGGIDGIIKEDKLGLDIIYIQAKRWEGSVGSPEIQKFVGALHGQSARKGIFITTSDFTKASVDYVEKIDSKIVLINGHQLSQLMIDYNIGVSVQNTYQIKKIDNDYFPEE